MTYAEVAFIQAEAAQRGLGGLSAGQAAGFYNAAIQASMTQWGVSAANANTFLAQPGVVYAGGTAGLVQIGQQKWLALFTDGGQAWAEWRRTCQPSTMKPGIDASKSTVPRRFEYPVLEYTVNEANVSATKAAQGADVYETRMYWDKSPDRCSYVCSGLRRPIGWTLLTVKKPPEFSGGFLCGLFRGGIGSLVLSILRPDEDCAAGTRSSDRGTVPGFQPWRCRTSRPAMSPGETTSSTSEFGMR